MRLTVGHRTGPFSPRSAQLFAAAHRRLEHKAALELRVQDAEKKVRPRGGRAITSSGQVHRVSQWTRGAIGEQQR